MNLQRILEITSCRTLIFKVLQVIEQALKKQGGKAMNRWSKVSLIILGFIFLLTFRVNAESPETKGEQLTPKSLSKLFHENVISEMKIEPLGDKLKIFIKKKKEIDLYITIPEGKFDLGFIKDGKLTLKEGWTITLAPEKYRIKGFFSVLISEFTNEGLYLELDEPMDVKLQKDKTDGEVTLKGRLKIAVPWGFSGFPYAGAYGSFVSGEIVIEPITDEKERKEGHNIKILLPYCSEIRVGK